MVSKLHSFDHGLIGAHQSDADAAGSTVGAALVKYDAMCAAIDAAHRVDEVKDIRDRALALEVYARQAINTDAERRCAEIRLRAERKAGQLLKKARDSGELREGRPGKTVGGDDSFTLDDFGITRDQSSQWQRLAAMPQGDFDVAVGKSVKPPTTKGILHATDPTPRRPTVAAEALWLWARLIDFERDGRLDKAPDDLLKTMTDSMKDDVHRLAPKVANWLKRIGAMP